MATEIVPYLVFFCEVDFDLCSISWNDLVLELSPCMTFNEWIFCSWIIICLTRARIERLLVFVRLRHWDGLCRWFGKSIVGRVRDEEPFIFNFNSVTEKKLVRLKQSEQRG